MERPYRPVTSESRARILVRETARYFFYPILRLVLVPLYGVRVHNRHYLKGPGISVMNHCIHAEWFFLWHAVRPRYIRFTAEEQNMKRKDLGWFNSLLGVLGIPEDHPMAVAPAVSYALGRGELVHFFPEGVLKLYSQQPGPFMNGAAWFACRHNVPLIPVAEVLQKRRIQKIFGWWPPKVTLIAGKPLEPSEFRHGTERLRDTAQRITAEAEGFIRNTIAAESRSE